MYRIQSLLLRLLICPFIAELKVSPLKSMVIVGWSQVRIKVSIISRKSSLLKYALRTAEGKGILILVKSLLGSGKVIWLMQTW